MPTYDYKCTGCRNAFSKFLPITERDSPCKKKCTCGKKIIRAWNTPPVGGIDKQLGPGSKFKEIMKKLSSSVPERYREGLDKAASLRGGRLGTQ